MNHLPTRIALTHMSRDTNRGDFAILAATYHAILRADPNVTITAVSAEIGNVGLDDPTETGLTRSLGCGIVGTPTPAKHYFRGSAWRWLLRLLRAELIMSLSTIIGPRAFALMPRDTTPFFDTLRTADIVVAKGGSYIHALGGLREFLYLWRMLYPLRVAKRFNVRIVLLGVSIGEFESAGSLCLARTVLRDGVEIYVRERRSLTKAREQLEVAQDNVRVIPDIAFLTPRPAGPSSRSPSPHRRVTLGVTVRADHALRRHFTEPPANYVTVMSHALRRLIDLNPQIRLVFIPQVDDDAPVAQEVASKIARPSHVKLIDKQLDLDSLLDIYQGLDVLLGSRLHSVILAAVVGVPAVHVVYEPSKSYGTLELLEMADFGIDYHDIDADRVVTLIQRVLTNQADLSRALTARVNMLQRDVRRAVAQALRVTT